MVGGFQTFLPFVAAFGCLEFSMRGVPPVDKTSTIKSVRAYSMSVGVLYGIALTFD